MSPASPLPASTLVLLRPEPAGFSVLLMKRPSKSSFMAGMHVFPGGRMEPDDAPPVAGALGESLAARMGLAAALAEGYAQAALRETFEEMGLLITAAPAQNELRAAREAMARAELAWAAWPPAREAPAGLVYFDHWITPEIEPKRFDTRFFAAAVAADAAPEPNAESISWGFFSPAEALARVARGEMAMAPPTLVTMQRLARFTALDEALAGLAGRAVAPLQPVLAGGDPLTLALPGHPAHVEAARLTDNPTALILRDGAWDVRY